MEPKSIHDLSKDFIVLGSASSDAEADILKHVESCPECISVLKRVQTPVGELFLEFVHPTPADLFLLFHPEEDKEHRLDEEDRQIIGNHMKSCEQCRLIDLQLRSVV